jgi:tetratricopeptide (TPR) repeat protein
MMLGRLDEAEQALREGAAVDAKVYTQPHRVQNIHLANLAALLAHKGETAEAIGLFRKCLQLRMTMYGENDPESGKAMNNLGGTLNQQELFDEAVPLLQRATRIFGTASGDWRFWQGNSEHNLALALNGMKRWGEAEAAQRRSKALRGEIQATDSPDMLNNDALLGTIYLDSGRLQEAKVALEDALKRSVQSLPPGHPHLAVRHMELADCDFALGLFGEARTHYEESLRLGLVKAGERNPTVLRSRLGLGETFAVLGDPGAARAQLSAATVAVAALPSGNSQKLRAERLTASLTR